MDKIQVNELVSLRNIFKNNYFIIPDYQRGYSWEIGQVKDLINDIEVLLDKDGKDYKHFTGTIVAAKNFNDNNIYDIVDGQQRLTTLIILIKTIINYDYSKYSFLEQAFIKRGSHGNETLVLTPNSETKDFYEKVIIEDETNVTPILKSHSNILIAKNEFETWIKNKPKNIDKIINVVTKGLGFIFYTPVNYKEIGIMFEVINNRGKALSELEKIKNYFIYLSIVYEKNKLRENVNKEWVNILKNLNYANKTKNEEENTFLRNCYLVFFEPEKNEYDIYSKLKEIFPVNIKGDDNINMIYLKISKFITFLSESALHYAYFYNGLHFNLNYNAKYKNQLGKIITYLRCQSVEASIMPLYLAIVANKLDIKNNLILLNILERLNFRVYILPYITKRADSKQADLFNLAFQFHNKFNKGYDHKWLQNELKIFTKSLCDDKKFRKALTIEKDENFDFKDWRGLRYFLGRYEEDKREKDNVSWDIEKILDSRKDGSKKTNDILSVEHIWAKENRANDFPADTIEKRRLGNFILLWLGKNITLQHDDIPDKINKINELIKKGKIFDLSQLSEFKDEIYEEALNIVGANGRRWTKNFYLDLSKTINDIREKKLIKFAWETWKFKKDLYF